MKPHREAMLCVSHHRANYPFFPRGRGQGEQFAEVSSKGHGTSRPSLPTFAILLVVQPPGCNTSLGQRSRRPGRAPRGHAVKGTLTSLPGTLSKLLDVGQPSPLRPSRTGASRRPCLPPVSSLWDLLYLQDPGQVASARTAAVLCVPWYLPLVLILGTGGALSLPYPPQP